jgi:undecaprenyl pyrophosphate synthase
MNKSTLELVPQTQMHVAILLDGNGRWAASHGLLKATAPALKPFAG